MEQLNILVYGAGAIGMFFGSLLDRAGFNVTFVGREDRLELYRERGFKLKAHNGRDHEFQPQVVSEVLGLPPQDLVLITVKAFRTYEIGFSLLPVIKPDSMVLSLQNGLENEKILGDLLGPSLVMGAVASFYGTLIDPCKVEQRADAQIVFGELDHQRSEREDRLSKIFSHADISHSISDNITQEIWEKFIWNNAYNSISALTGTKLMEIYKNEALEPTLLQMMRETQQIAHAEGVEVSNQALAELMRPTHNLGDARSSMWQDIQKEEYPEIEELLGIIVQKGEEHNISTPVNLTIYNLLQLLLSSKGIEKRG